MALRFTDPSEVKTFEIIEGWDAIAKALGVSIRHAKRLKETLIKGAMIFYRKGPGKPHPCMFESDFKRAFCLFHTPDNPCDAVMFKCGNHSRHKPKKQAVSN